jgi:hypothetical protein
VDLKGYQLTAIETREKETSKDNKQKHGFSLLHPEEGRVGFQLMAEGEEEMNSWMEHLQGTIIKETEVELDSYV